jgi:hypothetical protein
MSYPNYEDFDEEDFEEELSKDERKIKKMRERQRKLPLLLLGFTIGGWVMGVASSWYLRRKKN